MEQEVFGGDHPEGGTLDARERFVAARRAIVAEQLRSREGIAGVRQWRGLDRLGEGVRKVRRACDAIAAERRSEREGEKGVSPFMRQGLTPFSGATRVDELIAVLGENRYQVSSEKIPGIVSGVRPEVARIAEQVRKAQSSEGEVDVFDLLTSDTVSAGAKAKWLETQLASAIRFLEARDLADARAKAAEPPPDDVVAEKWRAPNENVPPPDADDFAPSVDEVERAGEGEPGAFFTVRPFYGGYYRGRDYDSWDTQTMRWVRLPTRPAPAEAPLRAVDERSRRVTSGTIRAGKVTALPMPYGFIPDPATLKVLGGGSARVLADGRGGWLVEATGGELSSFTIEIGHASDRGVATPPLTTRAVPEGAVPRGCFAPATEQLLTEVAAAMVSPYEKARRLKAFVKRTLSYSNDSSLNAVHRSGDPTQYFSRVESSGKADCDVANSYFAALCSRAGITVRMVPGHYVKTKDRTGAAVLSLGTGHAWLEVYDPATPGGRDGGWHKLDATPPGDPNMDEGDPDEQNADALGEGDYGEQDVLSKDELEQMIQEAMRELDRKEREPKERAAAAFAAEAECTPEEAKQILEQMDAARELRDREGKRIHDRLKEQFQKIVRENLREALRYEAPVRMSLGTSLEDPVEAMLGIRAGEADPTGFGRERQKIEREQVYGGLDVVLVADKSGSMGWNTPSGKPRWQVQQQVIFLAMDALHDAAQDLRAQRVRLLSPMDIRTGLVIFKADGAEIKLPLGTAWTPKEQYQVWKALQENVGGGTPDHLGMDAAGEMLGVKHRVFDTPTGEGKDRVRVVLEYSDGESDDAAAFAASIAALRKRGIIADAYRKELDGYPEWVAEHVIVAAAKLIPQRVKR